MSEVDAIMASLQLGPGNVIQSLPPELLLKVFRLLQPDLLQVSTLNSVCKDWRAVTAKLKPSEVRPMSITQSATLALPGLAGHVVAVFVVAGGGGGGVSW